MLEALTNRYLTELSGRIKLQTVILTAYLYFLSVLVYNNTILYVNFDASNLYNKIPSLLHQVVYLSFSQLFFEKSPFIAIGGPFILIISFLGALSIVTLNSYIIRKIFTKFRAFPCIKKMFEKTRKSAKQAKSSSINNYITAKNIEEKIEPKYFTYDVLTSVSCAMLIFSVVSLVNWLFCCNVLDLFFSIASFLLYICMFMFTVHYYFIAIALRLVFVSELRNDIKYKQ